ncbi:putative BIR-domain-containing protein [Seiridium cardinale]
MEDTEMPDHYFTHEGRLASFHSAQPVANRKPTAKGKGPKALTWPHKRIDPTSLAQAGFYFEPTPEYPDNAVCFLCHKMVGGWEDGDDPIEEHLRLSPNCGWAIVTAIESRVGDYNTDDPSHPDMMDARKATFAGRWPHEGKRGWKCKVKQMVDAGWKYTPTLDSDDMATCTYCQLALDGWEPSDKPMNEHYKRSPECPFFILINQYQQQAPAKKTGRGKGTRTSKASRLSSQSVATLTSEAPSTLDYPADHEDSVMTTASVATAGGTKRGRAKKATTAKGKKTRSKKDEPVEVLEDPPEEELAPPPPPKPMRGRKRTSDAIDDSVLTNAEAPAPKKRATRVRQSNTVDTSVVEPPPEQDMVDTFPAPPAKTTKKKGGRPSKNTRKISTASTASNTSFHNAAEELPDDEELDRQLQADLDKPLSDDEMITADSDSERKKAPAKGKGKKTAAKKAAPTQEPPSHDHAMFDPAPAEMNDADVSAELKELREQMESEAQEALQVPKKGRKAGTRKPSKQTKAQKTQQAASEAEPEVQEESHSVLTIEGAQAPSDPTEQHDISLASNATVLRSSTATAPAPKKRGRPKKNSTQPPPQPEPEAERVIELTQLELPTEVDQFDFADPLEKAATPRVSVGPKQPRKKSLPPPPVPEDELQAPATPGPAISPAPAARQATISPSQSPQSSDAENQPPSSKPSNTTSSSRLAMAPVATTPVHSSPSKRNANMFVGLESTKPWEAVDLELVIEELGKENTVPGSSLLKGVQLTTPEKKMTVEEWIYHNASLAEHRLKVECETMVSKFESEGGRAMRSLEEMVVEE